MKIFFLVSEELGIFPVVEVIDTKNFYLVPVNNSFDYEKYSKKIYRLEIVEGIKLTTEDK